MDQKPIKFGTYLTCQAIIDHPKIRHLRCEKDTCEAHREAPLRKPPYCQEHMDRAFAKSAKTPLKQTKLGGNLATSWN